MGFSKTRRATRGYVDSYIRRLHVRQTRFMAEAVFFRNFFFFEKNEINLGARVRRRVKSAVLPE